MKFPLELGSLTLIYISTLKKKLLGRKMCRLSVFTTSWFACPFFLNLFLFQAKNSDVFMMLSRTPIIFLNLVRFIISLFCGHNWIYVTKHLKLFEVFCWVYWIHSFLYLKQSLGTLRCFNIGYLIFKIVFIVNVRFWFSYFTQKITFRKITLFRQFYRCY